MLSVTKMNAIGKKNDVTTRSKKIKPIHDLKPVIPILSTFFPLYYFYLLKLT